MSLFIGAMSGTSMDGIDSVLVSIDAGKLSVTAHYEQAIPSALTRRLNKALDTANLSALEAWRLDALLGDLFADGINTLLSTQGLEATQISAIGSHGQTLYHAPNDGPALTVQIADANIIAQRTGITTVSDFRRMDIAAGGQGAPLAPAFHAYAFSHPLQTRCVLNLGGIANISVLPPSNENKPIVGFDTGPANTLMDLWIAQNHSKSYDENGQWASRGNCNEALLNDMLADDYFSRTAPKSTGREYFNSNWLQRHINRHAHISASDVQRTLCELTASTVAQALRQYAPRCEALFVCGGGALNSFLLQTLRTHLPNYQIQDTESLGVPAKHVEGAAFAWLAHERLHRRNAVAGSITGAKNAVCLGAVYHPVGVE